MATRNQNRGALSTRSAVGVRVQTQGYGLIEWNGLCGFVSYGLEPAARTGRSDELAETIRGTSDRCELGRVSEPMN